MHHQGILPCRQAGRQARLLTGARKSSGTSPHPSQLRRVTSRQTATGDPPGRAVPRCWRAASQLEPAPPPLPVSYPTLLIHACFKPSRQYPASLLLQPSSRPLRRPRASLNQVETAPAWTISHICDDCLAPRKASFSEMPYMSLLYREPELASADLTLKLHEVKQLSLLWWERYHRR